MKPFKVLDRNQDVFQSYLLEASAGTGKTFSIENIVVRLLIEEREGKDGPCVLDEILVVTFTNAATRDLKIRVCDNIRQVLARVRERVQRVDEPDCNAPDYLLAIFEQGVDAVLRAKKRLESALKSFDTAHIYTIHSFCRRMLCQYPMEGDVGLNALDAAENIPESVFTSLIGDFFHTAVSRELISPGQFNLLVGKKGVKALQDTLCNFVQRGLEIEAGKSFQECFEQFCVNMRLLKERYTSSKLIMEDFHQQADNYKKIAGKNDEGRKKKESEAKAARFALLFDKESWDEYDFDMLITDGLFFPQVFNTGNLDARKAAADPALLHYPRFTEDVQEALGPIFAQARNKDVLLSTLAKKCKLLIDRYLDEQEMVGFNGLLELMQKAVKMPAFAAKVRGQFRAAIIDEFQDTDPMQWGIFSELFLNPEQKPSMLYLVGDPKQSIYAFRQADIYTYLGAAKRLGSDRQASLDTNYRSQPSLVRALNALFSEEAAPGLIDLPRLGEVLSCPAVRCGGKVVEKNFQDACGSVHFFVSGSEKKQDRQFFSFILSEIQRLIHSDGLQPDQFAVLVSDRRQAADLCAFFDEWALPYCQQRPKPLSQSFVVKALKELLEAVWNPRQASVLKLALGGPFLGWTEGQMGRLQDLTVWERVLAKFQHLRQTWHDQGFASFFEALLQSLWMNSEETVAEHLLRQTGGEEVYDDLCQLGELLAEQENLVSATPTQLIRFLAEMAAMGEDDERYKKRLNPDKDGIRILTLHSSKGLEFDVVFALGLKTAQKKVEELIPILDSKGALKFAPVSESSTEQREAYAREVNAEKIRQLYVAMTRAKYRLYVPVAFSKSTKSQEQKSAIRLYMDRLRPTVSSYQDLVRFVEQLPAGSSVTCSCLDEVEFCLSPFEGSAALSLLPPPEPRVPEFNQYLNSFTSSAHKEGSRAVPQGTVPAKPPRDFDFHLKTAHTLPSSRETGILLHSILENFPLGKWKGVTGPALLHDYISPYLKGTPFADWKETIAEIIYSALAFPLVSHQSQFNLLSLNAGEFYREMEFLYPCDGGGQIPGGSLKPGFVKGVVDLIFTYDSKYYLVDWKSNWLGGGLEFYNLANMRAAMEENAYYFQAALYKQALEKYLRVVDTRPFNEIFGGVYYIFLRGLDKRTGTGIYFVD